MNHVAFVAGATGYTGREVVRALREKGVRTIAHVRPSSRRRESWQAQFGELGAEVDLSPWERDALVQSFERTKPTMVFALLGITKASAKREAQGGTPAPTYDSVDYGLTALLLRAASSVEPRPRFIYLSSAGIPKSEPRAGSYLHARWKVEKELAESDLRWVSARPSIITGDDRDESRPGERIGGSVLDGALAVAGALGMKRTRDRYRSTTNVILAQALVRLALDETKSGIVESEHLR